MRGQRLASQVFQIRSKLVFAYIYYRPAMTLDAVFSSQFNTSAGPQMIQLWETQSVHNDGALAWHYIIAANMANSFTLQV